MPNRQLTLLLMLGVALFTAGCGNDTSQGGECTSALQIDLVMDNIVIGFEGLDPTINEVVYTISGNGLDPAITGTIDTSNPHFQIALELPAGEGYLVELEATSEDGKTICRGHENFDVTIGEHTQVRVYLYCSPGRRLGAISADGWFNICAELTYRIVSPGETAVGTSIVVTSAAEDDDGDDGDIQYSWTSTFMRGSFGDPSAQSTLYTCEQEGIDKITLTVSDDDFESCNDIWSVPVTCGDETGAGGGGGTGGSGSGGVGGGSGTGGSGTGGSGGVGGGSGTGGTGGVGGGSGTGGIGGGSGTGGTGNGSGTGGTGNGSGTGGTGNGSGTGGTGGNHDPCQVSLGFN